MALQKIEEVETAKRLNTCLVLVTSRLQLQLECWIAKLAVPKEYRTVAFSAAVCYLSPGKSARVSISRIFRLLNVQLCSTGTSVRFDVSMVELQLELVSEAAPL